MRDSADIIGRNKNLIVYSAMLALVTMQVWLFLPELSFIVEAKALVSNLDDSHDTGLTLDQSLLTKQMVYASQSEAELGRKFYRLLPFCLLFIALMRNWLEQGRLCGLKSRFTDRLAEAALVALFVVVWPIAHWIYEPDIAWYTWGNIVVYLIGLLSFLILLVNLLQDKVEGERSLPWQRPFGVMVLSSLYLVIRILEQYAFESSHISSACAGVVAYHTLLSAWLLSETSDYRVRPWQEYQFVVYPVWMVMIGAISIILYGAIWMLSQTLIDSVAILACALLLSLFVVMLAFDRATIVFLNYVK